MRKKFVFILILILLIALTATASGLTFSYWEGTANYDDQTYAPGAFTDNWAVMAEYLVQSGGVITGMSTPYNYENYVFPARVPYVGGNVVNTIRQVFYNPTTNQDWSTVKSAVVTVRIQGGITTVENSVFAGCTNLKSVTVGSLGSALNGTTFGRFCFQSCISLDTVTVLAGTNPTAVYTFAEDAFINCASAITIYTDSATVMIGETTLIGGGTLTKYGTTITLSATL
jgi:hypothetical protein